LAFLAVGLHSWRGFFFALGVRKEVDKNRSVRLGGKRKKVNGFRGECYILRPSTSSTTNERPFWERNTSFTSHNHEEGKAEIEKGQIKKRMKEKMGI
jgi:hypothetical protein